MWYTHYVRISIYCNDELIESKSFGNAFSKTEARTNMVERVNQILDATKKSCTCVIDPYDAVIISGNKKYVLDVVEYFH